MAHVGCDYHGKYWDERCPNCAAASGAAAADLLDDYAAVRHQESLDAMERQNALIAEQNRILDEPARIERERVAAKLAAEIAARKAAIDEEARATRHARAAALRAQVVAIEDAEEQTRAYQIAERSAGRSATEDRARAQAWLRSLPPLQLPVCPPAAIDPTHPERPGLRESLETKWAGTVPRKWRSSVAGREQRYTNALLEIFPRILEASPQLRARYTNAAGALNTRSVSYWKYILTQPREYITLYAFEFPPGAPEQLLLCEVDEMALVDAGTSRQRNLRGCHDLAEGVAFAGVPLCLAHATLIRELLALWQSSVPEWVPEFRPVVSGLRPRTGLTEAWESVNGTRVPPHHPPAGFPAHP